MLRGRRHAWGNLAWCVAGAVLLTATSLADAANFAWGPGGALASGSTSKFSWSLGRNVGTSNLYGDPTILDLGFDFSSTNNFTATNAAGGNLVVVNTASAKLTAGGIGVISEITIVENGTWSAPGGEAPASIFTFQADISLTQIVPVPAPTQPVDFSTSISFNPNGTWTARTTLIPAAGPFVLGIVSASNSLQVSGTASQGSTFQKLGSRIVVPEPATAALFIAAVCPVLLRRRKRVR